MYDVGMFWGCTLTNIDNKDSCNVDIELEGDGAFDIYENAPISIFCKCRWNLSYIDTQGVWPGCAQG